MDKISGWQSEEELLFFSIALGGRSFICSQSYQNGFSLKLNTAIKTIISDVLLTTKACSALLS